uniref:Uncharacterized protein n=1 Tax=Setaria italica TaxID=4555 RepID=K4A414_SETIT
MYGVPRLEPPVLCPSLQYSTNLHRNAAKVRT